MFKRLHRRRPVSAILIFLVIFSMLAGFPTDTGAKTRKRAASASKSKAKKGKTTARSSRARASRRGRGRVKYVRVRVRGRNGRWTWKRRPLVASTRVHGVGVHNYLAEAWTTAQDPTTRGPRQTVTEIDPVNGNTMSAQPAPPPAATASPDAAAQPATNVQPATTGAQPAAASTDPADAVRPRVVNNPEMVEAPPFNPLVSAYAESLDARGISPESQGFMVATMNGEVLAEHNADRLFNPASVTKVATTLTVISRLGPDFRFKTSLYTDGALDPSTGVLHGSLYLVGSGDPAFFAENALLIADKLNRSGIRQVDGNLFVLGQFYFSFSASRDASAKAFRSVITAEELKGAHKTAYSRFLAMRSAEDRAAVAAGGKLAPPLNGAPRIKIEGQTITDSPFSTSKLTLVAVHTSLPLLRVLKGLNDFSDNWMASMVGSLVGGPDAVERFLKTEVGFRDEEVNFATSSGLGSNAISPRGTVSLLRKLVAYLNSKNLGPEDILPIAGVDGGTLGKRFTDAFRGSVVAKTGTLSSVSALAGVAYTRSKGPLLFVIYNQGRSARTFRPIQDETVKKLITLYGGPAPVRPYPTIMPRVSEQGADGSASSARK